ncbi:hypothetical protein KV134_05425 [Tetragenococcus halophilus]|uniref:Uncharacterized protein n=2 Tax=Tetragenococcus halophilus TaxID=51669 RepID=A0A2H6DYV9_TETHA|nr:hypothetical protein [Tetragenococcus halophilus]AOF48933.1 hypothetical protein AC806_05785 [Tetragenococcus halophilus]AYW50539.1 hypothetical protein C7H83_08720 [Tetragenococcus halophilus]MCF1602179.1 hypothetical protein [Tetragenococcus halophilus]MCF1676165.1 hypothetical protein [Tetragenococcus halophilus]MCO7026331.1 hypothetical protein [Tetragenococcus halophilus]
MITIKGKVTKIKVIKLSTRPLIHFKVNNISCLIASHSLNFLYEVREDNNIVIAGNYNNKNQFVVKKYCVVDKVMKI